MYTADTLSRAPVAGSDDDSLQEEVEVVVNGIVEHSLPATEQCLNTCIQEQDLVSLTRVSRLLNITEKTGQGKDW